jgi:hypothetical protein
LTASNVIGLYQHEADAIAESKGKKVKKFLLVFSANYWALRH